ncbi:GTPase-associated protein 1-related protein [Amycolatopsis alba]|uniref:Uncharacterized protein n=1 Tax=Amycolatopsis alba DSM 44262 TaxID=1125972 RepID=A0A229RKP3_AMYAL|nr:GTPase-associated protein 1-related protein [Amycolatopsis alba]OXM47041.1 hypothetical protein CFP75_25535 [Amycolatopsis alba DSM 44262]
MNETEPSRFDSLYYTDCVPGQGLRGGAGFQFQAVSAGVSHDTMSLVQRTSLYEAPVAWMREQRDVADYPPSLTHVHDDGVYATARGRYLGTEANGVREGNQFTHAVATTDPDTYGLVRPAQLWEAPWWAEKAAPTTNCEPVAADPEAGPWGIDAVREWVLGRPDGEEWLLAVQSAFDLVHEPGGRRVLFVGADVTEVLGWISAGTVLMAQRRALRLGFRVFATNPRQSRHDVLAVHDDWAGSFGDPARDNGFVVFNLTTGRHSEIEFTEGARFWVPRFLREDPYDVVDAIELAQRFAGKEARPSASDRSVAAIVTLGETAEGTGHAGDLVRWLADCPAPQPEEVVHPVLEAVLAADPDITALRALPEATEWHGAGRELADRGIRALFEAELAQLTGAVPVVEESGSLAAIAEAAANVVEPERMDELLRLCTRFDVTPNVGGFTEGARRFTGWWVEHKNAPLEPDRWSCREQMIDLLRDELAGLLERPDGPHYRDDIKRFWWEILVETATDVSTPLDSEITASAIAGTDAAYREELIDYVLDSLRSADPETRGHLMWRATFAHSLPSIAELTSLLEKLAPGPLTDWLGDKVGEALDAVIGPRLSVEGLDVLALAYSHGDLPGRPEFADFARQDKGLKDWLAVVAGGRPPRASGLRQITEPIMTARAADITAVFLDRLPVGEAGKLLERSGGTLPAVLLRELPRHWYGSVLTQRADTAVALTFVAVGAPGTTEQLAVKTERALRKWLKQADKQRLARVSRLLDAVDQRVAGEWRQFSGVKEVKPTGQTARAKQRGAEAAKKAEEKKPAWWSRRSNKDR